AINDAINAGNALGMALGRIQQNLKALDALEEYEQGKEKFEHTDEVQNGINLARRDHRILLEFIEELTESINDKKPETIRRTEVLALCIAGGMRSHAAA